MKCPRCKSGGFLNVGSHHVCALCGFELSRLGLVKCMNCDRKVKDSHVVLCRDALLILCPQCKKVYEEKCPELRSLTTIWSEQSER
jgi:hypothetical protein